MYSFLLTTNLQYAKDIKANFPDSNYIYFARMNESSRKEVMDDMYYHLYRATIVLSIDALQAWGSLFHR